MLKTWTKVVDSHSNQLSRVHVESKLLETKPFQSIINKDRCGLMSLAGIENQDATIENRVSILDLILDSHEDWESSVNLLLNGTVDRIHCHATKK